MASSVSAICPCCGNQLYDHEGICGKAVEYHLKIAENEVLHQSLMFRIFRGGEIKMVRR